MSVNTKDMTREEWLQARQSGLGGSDAGTILGVNRWKSKTQLFFEKTNPEMMKEVDNEYIYWGNVLEDIVAKEFSKRTGKKVRRNNHMLRHPEHDFMLANLDRVVVGENALLECKTTSHFSQDQWIDDEIPPQYLCQVQHYMAVGGFEKAYICVLIGGNKFVIKEVERDDELIEIIINAEKDFWENYVLTGVIPEIDGSEASTKFLNSIYSDDLQDESIELDSESDLLIKAIDNIKKEISEKKELQTEYENKLKNKLGHNTIGRIQDYVVTWKPQTRKTLDRKKLEADLGKDKISEYLKETSYRRLAIKNQGVV